MRLGRRLFSLLIIVLVCLYIALPDSLSIAGNTLYKQPIDFTIGDTRIAKKFDLILGLDLVGGSHLAFEADTSKVSAETKQDALESLKEVIERRVNLFGVSEPNIALSSYEDRDRVIVELPGVSNTSQAIELVGKTAQLNFARLQEENLVLTDLTGADLISATVVFDQTTGAPIVQIKFTDQGGEKFAQLTAENVGKTVAIVLDGEIVSAPTVNEAITGGSAVIQGGFDLDQAKALSVQLNAGALPLPLKLVEERTVGATLGSESVQKSVQAGVVGIILVMLFMVLMYGKLGLIADAGLIIFGIITLALYKLIPVVLTLPGIAGFLLSVGMAVDSNILIFERFKEERKIRHNLVDALENSFGRAWDSIRDANIATLITAFILANPLDWSFLHTSGPVRGFALTLALGILISMFTGIYVSRNLLRFFVRPKMTNK